MEQLIIILIAFVALNALVKLSFWRWWQSAIFAALCAAFILWVEPYAIEQSKTQIADYLANTKALQDMAVIITIETVICFAYCFNYLGDVSLRFPWGKILRFYPSLLLFPVLFYCLTELIFSLTGVDFETTSYIMAAGVLLGIPALSALMKWLLPDEEQRIEIHLLLSLFVCILGLLSTVNNQIVYF